MVGIHGTVQIKRMETLTQFIKDIEDKTVLKGLGNKKGWWLNCPVTPITPNGKYLVRTGERARTLRDCIEMLKGFSQFNKLIGMTDEVRTDGNRREKDSPQLGGMETSVKE